MLKKILITGSNGFVGSTLVKSIKNTFEYFTTDLVGNDLSLRYDLSKTDDLLIVEKFIEKKNIDCIIHLAALRSDFGHNSNDFFVNNVIATENLIKSIKNPNQIKYFLHIGSVAEIDGQQIKFSNKLSIDNAYRCTKFLQLKIIKKFCNTYNIPLCVLSPSAIFNDQIRNDTNISTLQKIVKKINFFPAINVKKTLTYLPNFCDFIIESIIIQRKGCFICVEKPILNISEIVKYLALPNKMKIFSFPGLYYFLTIFTLILPFNLLKKDMKLTNSRVKKLFKDTTYLHNKNYDLTSYPKNNEIVKILSKI